MACFIGSETVTLITATVEKRRVAQRKMKRSMIGVTSRDGMRNGDMRGRTGVSDVVENIARLKWNWARHIARMRNKRWKKRLLE